MPSSSGAISELKLALASLLLRLLSSAQGRAAAEGASLTLHVQVNVTPNPSFRRLDVQVFEKNWPILRVSTVVGQ
jgi:hypothetical protein